MIEFPPDWQTTQIGKTFSIKQGKSLSRQKQTGNNLRPFLRTANVFWGSLKIDVLDEMSFTDNECETLALKCGDLLVCEGGDIGRTAIWRGEIDNCLYQNHLHRLRRLDNNVLPLFMMYWLQAGMTQLNAYEGAGNKTTIPNLSRSRLSEFQIPLPPLPEQKKIATVLLKIQRAIETQEKIIQSLRDLKKSTMQHLFTYGLRGEKTKMTEIGEIPESWEVVPLEKMYQITKKPRETTYTEFESIAFIPMECIPSFELFINEWRMKSPDQLTSGTYFEAGDLLLSKITPCFENGKQGIAKGIPNGFGIATTEVIPIKCLSGVSNIVFLSFYLQNVQVRLAIAGKMEGATGRQRVPVHLIRNWPIPFPATLKEQIDIANMLLSLDNKVSWHHTKKSALQSLFKTTLNKLMTGDIRVADLDIDVKEVEV